jgi:hypothetical protein
LFSGGIREGVQEGYTLVELFLHGGRAGDRERYVSEFFRDAVVVNLLRRRQ